MGLVVDDEPWQVRAYHSLDKQDCAGCKLY